MALIDIVLAADNTLRCIEKNLAEFGFGRGALTRRAMPPMVTWILAPDAFEPSEQMRAAKGQPQVTMERWAGCEAHIWAVAEPTSPEDHRACELLLHQVVAALRAVVPGKDLRVTSGRPEDETTSQTTAYGRAYVLSFAVRIPILQIATQGGPVQPTAVGQTSQINPTS